MSKKKTLNTMNPSPTWSSGSPPRDKQPMVDRDAAIASIIRGVTLLTAHARHNGLGNAARILSNAKEDLLSWANTATTRPEEAHRFSAAATYNAPTNVASELLHCINGMDEGAEREALLRQFNALLERATAIAADARTIASGKDYD